MKKKAYKTVSTLTNIETGEQFESVKQFFVEVKGDNFYITYIDSISGFLKIRNSRDMRTLAILCCMADFNTGEVSISPAKRKVIIKELGITTQTMSNIITRLRKLDLISGDDGEYMINPKCFWKGKSSDREHILNTTGAHFKLTFNNRK